MTPQQKKEWHKAEAAYDNGDYRTALAVWQHLASQGDAHAQYKVGKMYLAGEGSSPDPVEAEKWFKMMRDAAEEGNAGAQEMLGWMYFYGNRNMRNEEEGLRWYHKAYDNLKALASSGNPSAQYQLGMFHIPRVKPDQAAQRAWIQKAAEQGHAMAQWRLGWLFQHERLIQNWDEAEKWYRQAAEQGITRAQIALGLCYYRKKEYKTAFDTLVSLAVQDSLEGAPAAQNYIGRLYANGQGVQQDYSMAMKWWHRAAALGNSTAAGEISRAYELGRGVERDMVQAYVWRTVGTFARELFEVQHALSKKMTAAQVADAEKILNEWRASRPEYFRIRSSSQ